MLYSNLLRPFFLFYSNLILSMVLLYAILFCSILLVFCPFFSPVLVLSLFFYVLFCYIPFYLLFMSKLQVLHVSTLKNHKLLVIITSSPSWLETSSVLDILSVETIRRQTYAFLYKIVVITIPLSPTRSW